MLLSGMIAGSGPGGRLQMRRGDLVQKPQLHIIQRLRKVHIDLVRIDETP